MATALRGCVLVFPPCRYGAPGFAVIGSRGHVTSPCRLVVGWPAFWKLSLFRGPRPVVNGSTRISRCQRFYAD
jgi:hypothetical protein